MASYQYTAQREKAAREQARKAKSRGAKGPDIDWQAQTAHTRRMLNDLLALRHDADTTAWLQHALECMTFNTKPTSKELTERRKRCKLYLAYAFSLTDPRKAK